MSSPPRLCGKCGGQLTAEALACPWCGAPTAEAGTEGTRVGEPSPATRAAALGRKDIGLSGDLDKIPNLPPPPKALPMPALNPGQVMLRAMIVILGAYIVVKVSQPVLQVIQPRICAAVPNSQFCRH